MKHFNLKASFFFSCVLCFFSGFGPVKAQVTASGPKQFINSKDWSFVENKGQLSEGEGKTNADIKYYSHNGGPDIYCRPGMISFVFSKTVDKNGQEVNLFKTPNSTQNALEMRRKLEEAATNKTVITESSRADLVLLHANPNAQITGQDQQSYYENYYTAYTPTSGINQARTYKTIVYESIYPHINMLIHAKTGGLEYEFVIFPGGNVNDIQIQWNGLETLELLANGGMHYAGNMIDMQDSKPVSFITGGGQVPSSFVKHNATVSFDVADYDHTQALTIDPTLSWGTYLGGGSRNWGEAVWTDNSGNVLMCGPSTSPTSGIATSGAFQTSYGTYDAFLSKFSSAGSLQWCTYYGGSGYNDGWGLSSDNLGDIFMGGATSSTSGIATSGTAQSVYGGGSYGGYIVKFRSNGSRVWGTYYGSTANDQVLFVATDPSVNVFLTAWVSSSTGIATAGAYQTSFAGGSFDAGLAKYDSSGKQAWSTYFGGSGYDAGNVVATDLNGNSILIGQTASGGLATPGAYQTSNGGGTYDGFVASFSPSGALNWSSYIGGSGTDIAWGAVADQFGNVYVDGQTASTKGIAYNIPYQPTLPGTNNSFLSKFNSKGLMLWSTYYGGNDNDTANNVAVDPTGSIFVAGSTSSSSGISTANSYQSSLNGSRDAFFAKFSPAGNLMYGSYYGGGGYDDAIDIHADAIGNTYISGTTSSGYGIATSGGYSSTYSSATDNAFLAGFFFNNVANDAGIATMPTVMCAGKQDIIVYLENFGTKDLTSATIGWTLNGKTQTPVSWTGTLKKNNIIAVKLDTLTLSTSKIETFSVWTSKPNGVVDSMPRNDTLKSNVSAVALPKANAGGNKIVCLGSKVLIGSSPGSASNTYSWTSNPTGFTSGSVNPSVNPTVTTTYYLTVTTIAGGCSAIDSATVTVGLVPKPRTGDTSTICFGGNLYLGSKAVPGHAYKWSSYPSGFSSTISNPVANPVTATTYYETETDTATGCLAYGNETVFLNPEPKGNAGGNHVTCLGSSVTIGVSAASGHSYSWASSPTGFTSTQSNPPVKPLATTTYYFSDILTATGCTAGDTVIVTINPLPVAASGGNHTICSGSNILIGGKAVTGDTYSWKSKPTGYTSTLSNPVVNPAAATDYILTETITATGCAKTDTAIISTNPLPVPKTGGNQAICVGSSVQLGATPTTGHLYTWTSNPKGFTSNSSSPSASPTVTTVYYLTDIISATGCNKKDSAVVTVNFVTAHAGKDSTVCLGQPDTLGGPAISGNNYVWSSNPAGFTSLVSNPVVKPLRATTYYLQQTNPATGCSGSDSVTIALNPLPDASVGPNLSICAGETVSIGDTSSAVDSFSWQSSPAGFVSDIPQPTVTPLVTTTYSLTETNPSTGCSKTNSVKVTAKPLPNAKWFINYTGNTTNLHAKDSSFSASSYNWSLGDGNTATGHLVNHVYARNQTYSVRLTVTGTDGCTNGFDSAAAILRSLGIAQADINQQFELNVFPNPFQASTTVEYNLDNSTKVRILILDMTGRQIAVVADENETAGTYRVDIDAEKYHLSSGMYMLQFIKDNQFVSKHLVKM